MLEKPQSWVGDSLVPSLLSRNKFFKIAVKKEAKAGIKVSPVLSYLTLFPHFVQHVLSWIVVCNSK